MPFAHCIDCGSSALIDPSGRCPEGHIVGAAGARVSAAIGSDVPHPDEPQPWVSEVEVDPVAVETVAEPRTVRPPSLPSVEPVAGPSVNGSDSADDLLRELHALGDLGDVAAAPTDGPPLPVRPVTAPAPTPSASAAEPPAGTPEPAATTFDTPAPPSSPEEATDLASLANLAAAVRSLGDRAEDAARVADSSTSPTATPDTSAADLQELFAAAEPRTEPPASAPPAPSAPAPVSEVDTTRLPSVAAASGGVAPEPPNAQEQPSPQEQPTSEAAPQTAPALASPFAGGFTARGESVGRGGGGKGGRRGLFRR